ncbi:MAG: FliG C-terminal domain-containing protein [bacterium]
MKDERCEKMKNRKLEKVKQVVCYYLLFFIFIFSFLVLPKTEASAADTSVIEKQVSSVLQNVFNIRQFSVSVRIDNYVEIIDMGKDKRNILPGVPIEEKLTGSPSKQLVQKYRFLITVVLPRAVTLEMEQRVERLLKVCLSLKETDSLKILREEFVSAPPETPEAAAAAVSPLAGFGFNVLKYFSNPSNILLVAGVLIMFIFIFGPLRSFMRYAAAYFANVSQSHSPENLELGAGAVRGNPLGPVNLLASPGADIESRGETADVPFSFVNEKNISNLAFLLRDEDSEKIANIIGFFKETLIEKFVSCFPEEKQSDIMSFLVYKKELSSDDIRGLEQEIKERIDYVSGGKERLLKMLENSSRQVQEQFLQHIADEDPVLATELRNSIFHFEDLARQETLVVQTVLRFVNTRALAQALQFSDPEVKDRIFSILSEGARDIVTEELELLPENQTASLREQKNIVAVVRRLKDAGTIELG